MTGTARRVEVMPGVETWFGRDPAWHPPTDVAVQVSDSVDEQHMTSALAAAVLTLIDDPDGLTPDGQAVVLPWRIAVWVPDRWTEGLSADQVAAVRADLRETRRGHVLHVGMWMTMTTADATDRGVGGPMTRRPKKGKGK